MMLQSNGKIRMSLFGNLFKKKVTVCFLIFHVAISHTLSSDPDHPLRTCLFTQQIPGGVSQATCGGQMTGEPRRVHSLDASLTLPVMLVVTGAGQCNHGCEE